MLIYEKYFVLECNISLCSFEKNINCDKMHCYYYLYNHVKSWLGVSILDLCTIHL